MWDSKNSLFPPIFALASLAPLLPAPHHLRSICSYEHTLTTWLGFFHVLPGSSMFFSCSYKLYTGNGHIDQSFLFIV